MEEQGKTMQMTDTKPASKKRGKSGKIAKKDWRVVQNDIDLQFKKGEDIGNVPKHIIPNLITEGVIDK